MSKPRSRAIPIVDPESGQRLPVPAVPALRHLNGNRSGSSSAATSTSSDGKTNIKAEMSSSDESEEPIVSEGTGKPLDVYARPFVPEALTIINRLDGRNIDTPQIVQLDFIAHICGYIGTKFLPSIPRPIDAPIDVSQIPRDSVVPSHYERYFRHHLEAEIYSQQQENESYSLYGHNVAIESSNDTQSATLSLLIPGLRENSPYIEEDDIVQLRQLCYDYAGRVLGMENWLALRKRHGTNSHGLPALGGRSIGPPAPGWTGLVYNARVLGVQRKEEKLLLKVAGFLGQNPLNFGAQRPQQPKFNVQFPVPLLRYLPMQQVLPVIQAALKEAGFRVDAHQKLPQSANASSNRATRPSSSAQFRNHHWLQSMLFPSEENSELQRRLNPASFNRPFFDEELNWEQKKAIESICTQNYGTLPFLISGPPGTGKTKSLVETALQLITNDNHILHILFCAPSDPAADTIVQRLSTHLGPTDVLRLNRPSRTFAEVSEAVLPFCYVSNDRFHLPPFEILMSYRIVVTTCRDASLLMYSRMTNSDVYVVENSLRKAIHPHETQPLQVSLHWNALIIDEAAQAIEPEALIPLSVVAPPLNSAQLIVKPLFVMAGDEHQLGPRTSLPSSPLKNSLFARLFKRPVYADHPLARGKAGKAPPALNSSMLPILRPAFTNLIRNYRSHPAILAVPSALFYADTLDPNAVDTDRLAEWSQWRGMRWPVLFHNNDSEDELEQDGGGWYNVGEAQAACFYANNLVQTGLVEQKEVCIMSPFKSQVKCLRKTVREKQLWNVDVGPTEAFQGLERGVVILCTTRSKQRFVEKDKALDWGIIGMPNKMNVAITRAKFGLIVIGKRKILYEDPNWKAFLGFCDRNGLVTDVAQDGGQELTRLEKVLLTKGEDSVEDPRVLGAVSRGNDMWTSSMAGYEYE
ncbi:hypothetical protein G7Y89_g843 [Cudoniella acicularis]|uniref:RNA helicase n=1 Tax=Cudoniella acicularis TaxID=354080 RepID=A0A8H4W7J2_9HELO|nr:hypothetical protein G7Y89_g843 [Cudoniella acicularis]